MELVIDDDAFTGFAEPELVAELDLCAGLSAFDDVDVVVIKAEDLVLAGYLTSADDAFVGLFDGRRELI